MGYAELGEASSTTISTTVIMATIIEQLHGYVYFRSLVAKINGNAVTLYRGTESLVFVFYMHCSIIVCRDPVYN